MSNDNQTKLPKSEPWKGAAEKWRRGGDSALPLRQLNPEEELEIETEAKRMVDETIRDLDLESKKV